MEFSVLLNLSIHLHGERNALTVANIFLLQLHNTPLDEASIAHVLRGVLLALAYLHGENRIHRDVKVRSLP